MSEVVVLLTVRRGAPAEEVSEACERLREALACAAAGRVRVVANGEGAAGELDALAGLLRGLLALGARDRRACAAFLPLFSAATPENRALAAKALDETLGTGELAVLCGVDERSLRRWRGRLLAWERGRVPRGRKEEGDVEAWG